MVWLAQLMMAANKQFNQKMRGDREELGEEE
jgi:hypothetical protein